MGTVGDRKRKAEKRVAEKFCQLERGVLVEMRESPDASVQLDGVPWGIEIASYRSTELRKMVEHAEGELQRKFADARYAMRDTQHVSLTWHYRDRDLSLPDVPDFNTQSAFIAELLQMIRIIGNTLETERSVMIRFGTQVSRWPFGPQAMWIEPSDYPVVSKHCTSVRMHRSKTLRLIQGGSSMDSGSIGIDPAAVTDLLDAKCSLVPSYRTNMPDAKIGLVVHAEVLPMTAHIGDGPLMDNARRVFAEELAVRSKPFDGVWLGQYLQSGEAAELFRIY
jgi:hypothetical protein